MMLRMSAVRILTFWSIDKINHVHDVLPIGCRNLSQQSCNESPVICKEHDGIREIILNDADKRNVLSWNTLTLLRNFLNTETKTRCVIIGAKGSAFSGGHDLTELTATYKDSHLQLFDLCAEVMLAIKNFPVPVIAKVQGHAAAAGCQLAATCDIVVAAESAKFCTPGVNIGLFCSTPGVALARTLPAKISSYMLFTGLPITAKEAATYGLVSRLVPDERLDEETMKIAKNIASKSLPIVTMGKLFLQKQVQMPLSDAYREGAHVMADNLTFQDTQDGIDAFKKRIHPHFSNTSKKAY